MATTTTTTGEHRRIAWGPWSPAQLIVGALGGFLTVLGALVLFRGGVGDWTDPIVSVWGFSHTPLMAVIEVSLGLFILSAAADPTSAKGTLVGIGGLMAVFGIVTLADPGAFREVLGVDRQMGVLYTTFGVGGFVLGHLSPVIR